MSYTYLLEGMTCMGCVERIKAGLETIVGEGNAIVDLQRKTAIIKSNQKIDLPLLQSTIGKYQIKEHLEDSQMKTSETTISTYKPLILIIGFIAGVCLLVQYPFSMIKWDLWMRHFMAGFFIVFSFFKLLNLEGFADSYSMYDVLTKRWKPWGYIYPFVELFLGVMYLINLFPWWTNVLTILVLGISSIGVIQSNLKKRKIQCACLGDVFNLPMSTVTIVENVTMIGMAIFMLF